MCRCLETFTANQQIVRMALSLYKVYGDSTLLVLNGSLKIINAFLAADIHCAFQCMLVVKSISQDKRRNVHNLVLEWVQVILSLHVVLIAPFWFSNSRAYRDSDRDSAIFLFYVWGQKSHYLVRF